MNLVQKALHALIRAYQKYMSPHFPPRCIYTPSCSTYGLEAIERHGAVKGSLMAVARILRCNPWARGGLDTVPAAFRLSRNPSDAWQNLDVYPPLTAEEAAYYDELYARYREKIRQVSAVLPEDLSRILEETVPGSVQTLTAWLANFSPADQEELLDRWHIRNTQMFDVYIIEETKNTATEIDRAPNAQDEAELHLPSLLILEGGDVWWTNAPEVTVWVLAHRGLTSGDVKYQTPRYREVLTALAAADASYSN